MRMVNGSMTTAVAIKTDGEQTIDPACVPPTVTDKPSLMAAVQNCGLVGVGGAGFPAHVKLAANTIDTLLDVYKRQAVGSSFCFSAVRHLSTAPSRAFWPRLWSSTKTAP